MKIKWSTIKEYYDQNQTLFFRRIEPGILRIRPWKELLATGVQTTWLEHYDFKSVKFQLENFKVFLRKLNINIVSSS
jgi:hypothetical protein